MRLRWVPAGIRVLEQFPLMQPSPTASRIAVMCLTGRATRLLIINI